jgi:hypothetical protein
MLPDDAPSEAQAKPVRRIHTVVGCLVVLGLVAGLCGGGWLVVRYLAAGAEHAKVRDCLAEDRGESPPYRRVSCEDAEARYRVLLIAERPLTGGNPCVDVPGASRLFDRTEDDRIVCIGVKDADPAKAANIAKEGDCLRVVRDAGAERLDCTDPRANFEVLRRLTDVYVSDLRVPFGDDDSPCSDVPATTTRYSFQWRTEQSEDAAPSRPGLPGKHFDLMFCLGRVHEPPPAVPGATGNCRFVKPEDVLAAVNSVDGKQHDRVSPGRPAGPRGCTYALLRVDGGHDAVTLNMSGEFDWPPSAREEFTIDGLKAAWRANPVGVAYLSVARPGGNFEIVLTFKTGYSYLREAAVAVYQAAEPHLP